LGSPWGGWEPEEFIPKSGEPKIDEDILKAMEYPEAPLITKLWTIDKRISQLATGDKAWLKMVGPDGRIHGRIDTLGAVTRRMSHFAPNMSQVPAVYSPYGGECRALFIAPPAKVVVGIDAAGLEARCLAHYLALHDGGAYAQAVLEGSKEEGTDVHTVNMIALGITSRDDAKTWFYAWLYGAGAQEDLKGSDDWREGSDIGHQSDTKFLSPLRVGLCARFPPVAPALSRARI
jgi:DNA polymerase I